MGLMNWKIPGRSPCRATFYKDWNVPEQLIIPEFFLQALKYIEEKHITNEGIYRKGHYSMY